MSESSSSESLQQLGNTLHQRLIDGDPTATSQIAVTFLSLIIQRLRRKFPSLPDPDMVDAAAGDAFINYFERPSQYDPAKGSLDKYLFMSARGDLLNLREQTNKIRARNVELDASNAEYEVEIPDAFDLEGFVIDRNSPIWQRLLKLFPDPVDQKLVSLLMENVRETAAYAEVLGISTYPPEEQASQVKRHKDRLKKKLQRNKDRLDLGDNG
jgi:RNA polymerase sigma-70 factor (ECF subfamily)